jgi:hypothetical protein
MASFEGRFFLMTQKHSEKTKKRRQRQKSTTCSASSKSRRGRLEKQKLPQSRQSLMESN